MNGQASCACSADYMGTPPNCRPECIRNSECPSNQACIQKKCRYPCEGVCGVGAQCSVINHTPICNCADGYTGDPFVRCSPALVEMDRPVDSCSNCGPNTQCLNGVCTCLPEYQGDPQLGCRPECVLNSDCSRDRACISNRCKDPCDGTCGEYAVCSVVNHVPVCTCPPGTSGNAFIVCSAVQGTGFFAYDN